MLGDRDYRKTKSGREFLVALAGQIGAADRGDDVAAVVGGLAGLPAKEQELGQALVAGLVSRRKGAARQQLATASGSKAAALLTGLLKQARLVAPDPRQSVADRVQAVRTLGLGAFEQDRVLFGSLLKLAEAQPVQEAVLETLGQFADPGVATLLLGRWRSLSPRLRRRAAETIFSRTESTRRLLAAVNEGDVARADLDPARVRLLRAHRDKQIRAEATRLFPEGGVQERKAVIQKYQVG